MKHLPLSFIVLAGTLPILSCRPEPLAPTGVLIDLRTEDPRLYAQTFQLVWLDQTDRLLDIRVPEEGVLDEIQAPAVSVFIGMADDRAGWRRLVARGYRGEEPVSEATAEFPTGPGVWTQIGVPMLPVGSLVDSDADGLPDSIDHCPRDPDPCPAQPPGVDLLLDAGPPRDAGDGDGDG
jgi:hypothetical protein